MSRLKQAMKTTRKKRSDLVRTREREGDRMLNVRRMPSMNKNAVTAFVSLHAWLMLLESFLGEVRKMGNEERMRAHWRE